MIVSNLSRLIATAIIWGAVTMIMMAMLLRPGMDLTGDTIVVITAIMGAVAYLGTRAVWKSPYDAEQEAEKSKRHSRVDRMLSRLSDRDVAELRARLMGDDGEAVTMEDLLTTYDERKRQVQ
ncbi:MAG TPA: hypothetical protein VHO69_11415 [Phototrophicaceae bacterium]|nr:hypothetical protein [Phototrophicaceae bacterium]